MDASGNLRKVMRGPCRRDAPDTHLRPVRSCPLKHRSSSSKKRWRSLLQKRRDPLSSLVGRSDPSEGGLFDSEAIIDRIIHAAMNGAKSCGERKWRLSCKKVRDRQQFLASPISAPRNDRACGRMKVGLTLVISVKTGIGSGRSWARRYSAMPPPSDPVKVTALIKGWSTSASPTALPALRTIETAILDRLADGAGHDLRRSGVSVVRFQHHGAARRQCGGGVAAGDRVGDREITRTEDDNGPSAIFCMRWSKRGRGWRSGWAGSIVACRKRPLRTTSANCRNWVAALAASASGFHRFLSLVFVVGKIKWHQHSGDGRERLHFIRR
jgi:hypothetical protein